MLSLLVAISRNVFLGMGRRAPLAIECEPFLFLHLALCILNTSLVDVGGPGNNGKSIARIKFRTRVVYGGSCNFGIT
ncbi:hypothetical protein GGS24DRAFT_471877 [Hypoxylon argillaceum]|nr:hypothetical protein GGS24DRAFT_471877 [Hypoxylon argillaceum]